MVTDAPVSTVTSMSGACWPTMLDMRNGYLKVPMPEASPSNMSMAPLSSIVRKGESSPLPATGEGRAVEAGGLGGGPHRERASARGVPPLTGGEGVAQTGTDADAALTPDRTERDKQEGRDD